MKMTKKLLSVVLAGAMTMSLSTPVLADTGENVYTIPEQGMWINNMEITPLSEMEQAQYSEYELRPVAMAYVNDVEITSSDILSLCNCIDEEIYDTHVVRTYTTDKVREFIKDCKKITSVSSLDNLVYVTYVASVYKGIHDKTIKYGLPTY